MSASPADSVSNSHPFDQATVDPVISPFRAITALIGSVASFEDMKPILEACIKHNSPSDVARFADIVSGASCALRCALPIVAVGRTNLSDRFDELKKLDEYLQSSLEKLDSQDDSLAPSS